MISGGFDGALRSNGMCWLSWIIVVMVAGEN